MIEQLDSWLLQELPPLLQEGWTNMKSPGIRVSHRFSHPRYGIYWVWACSDAIYARSDAGSWSQFQYCDRDVLQHLVRFLQR